MFFYVNAHIPLHDTSSTWLQPFVLNIDIDYTFFAR